jgi:hypothetical protein
MIRRRRWSSPILNPAMAAALAAFVCSVHDAEKVVAARMRETRHGRSFAAFLLEGAGMLGRIGQRR